MHLPPLVQDLAVILGIAAVITFLFRRIKQPVVLGYIVAGIIVGPYTPQLVSVVDTESIKVWAELGVIFLMFTLGLEFSFRRLARVGMSAGVTALVQIGAMLLWGGVTAQLLGWPHMDAVFLGCMIAISSTTIIIKALEELGLKTRKFAELVFGILIVEDLAAILMLVALTNIATTSQVGGVELLLAGGKLAIVVGVWFLVGIFVVPRFVRSVSHHGNDEMLTVVAIGLCLALVGLAAYFHYSAALGAFIMGSILAESAEAKRIEHLVQPLKDIFGAVFFVSVGMLLDPKTIADNLGAVALISVVIILGKLTSVTLGAFATGQTLRHSVQTGFSMAQIGEFSFIIASLGLSYNVISPKLYPIIVASSLVTTFTTPYLVKVADKAADLLERSLPARVRTTLGNYVAWIQRRSVASDRRKARYSSMLKWGLNAVVVITLFTLAADRLVPLILQYEDNDYLARGLAWIAAFALSSPSLWAMLSAFKEGREQALLRTFPRGGSLIVSRVLTVALVGLLTIEYFPAPVTLGVTAGLCAIVFLAFRRQIEGYYRWMEDQFRSGFQADLGAQAQNLPHDRLAPWDAHLVELRVPARSHLVGHTLLELALRETYGLNVVVIIRDGETLVAPKASEMIYPADSLLVFATDGEIERFRTDLEGRPSPASSSGDLAAYELRRMKIQGASPLSGSTIRDSGIRERFDCIVVGLERHGEKIRSPKSDLLLSVDDVLWVVGENRMVQKLALEFG